MMEHTHDICIHCRNGVSCFAVYVGVHRTELGAESLLLPH